MNNLKISIYDLSPDEMDRYFESIGEKRFRANQLASWLYKKRLDDFNDITDFSKKLRNRLDNEFYFLKEKIIGSAYSIDGTAKLLIELSDGEKIECVLIPEHNRTTLCLSTQAGCNVGCKYCVTATLGFKRNLKTSEIIAQYILAKEYSLENMGRELTNIVFMGMGEPLLNAKNVISALKIFTNDKYVGKSYRRVTISSVGIIEGMELLDKEGLLSCLTISIGGSNQIIRENLIPIGKKYTFNKIMDFCRTHRLPKKRDYTFAYVLLDNFNDFPENAYELAKAVKDIRCKINIIPYNENPVLSKWKTPSDKRIMDFQRVLMDRNIKVLLRKSRGLDINAACGMLKANEEKMA